ncbi:hypothetical protein [Spiroplasma endosymbiont of Nebria brevicollis]|uniref:hypothetical protein n=1 Tax=Spiroplasma endosymbiont of Nebria brevicollis TaxID=3066284 RepID=UPI00313C688F
MNLTSKEQELLTTYQNWLQENKLSNKCNAYFLEQISSLVFQVWNLEKQISESVWLKLDNCKWQYYIKNLGEKFVKFFSLEEILEIEKDFVVKSFK